jgi:8-oxo-dGTP diphosphatase
MTQLQRPLVGVGVIIHDKAGNIVMGERAGSHGAGKTYRFPLNLWNFLSQ